MFPLVCHLQNYTAQHSEIDRASSKIRVYFQCTLITLSSRRNYLIFTSRQRASRWHWRHGSNCILVCWTELLKSSHITSVFYMFCITVTSRFPESSSIRYTGNFALYDKIYALYCTPPPPSKKLFPRSCLKFFQNKSRNTLSWNK